MNIVSLTSVFGMGTGVTKLLWSSQIYLKLGVYKGFYIVIYYQNYMLMQRFQSGQMGKTQDLVA